MDKLKKRLFSLDRYDIAAILLIAVLGLFCCFMIRYSVGNTDEYYYLTIPHRMSFGDRLIIDEWSFAQLFAVFTYLPFKIFHMITGGTDGVVLYFRFIYVLIKLSVTTYIYIRLRKYRLWALIACFIYAVYNALMYNTVNYYNLCSAFLTLSFLVLFIKENKHKRDYVSGGVFIACACLCQPGLVLLIPVLLLYCVIDYSVSNRRFKTKKSKKIADIAKTDYLNKKNALLYTSVGLISSFILFAVIMFIGISPRLLIESLKNIFNDGQHGMPFMKKIKDLCEVAGIFSLIALIPTIISLICKTALKLSKKAYFHRITVYRVLISIDVLFLICCGIYLAYIILTASSELIYSYSFKLPLYIVLLSMPFWIISDKKDKGVTLYYLLGILASLLCITLSSYTTFDCMITANVPAVLILASSTDRIKSLFLFDGRPINKISKPISALMISSLLIFEFSWFCRSSFWRYEDLITENNKEAYEVLGVRDGYEMIDFGPNKGLYTKSSFFQYQFSEFRDSKTKIDSTIRKTAEKMNVDQREPKFYQTESNCYVYLLADLPYATYSAYTSGNDPDKIYTYWSLRSDNTPDILLLDDSLVPDDRLFDFIDDNVIILNYLS